ncbi:hypothetical protein CBR_g41621 [Chara braunii]|uniref:C2 domain-containing protein n=1 Tax=Chara braunii TaxID=69332 RepID=A0A388LW57_CHABU|nr:hypothetical protein CBR_g41621 [Chara braunii]|eukprot:GBG86558.1 hypothetical protein CBR_g41621 [Chara braunii]
MAVSETFRVKVVHGEGLKGWSMLISPELYVQLKWGEDQQVTAKKKARRRGGANYVLWAEEFEFSRSIAGSGSKIEVNCFQSNLFLDDTLLGSGELSLEPTFTYGNQDVYVQLPKGSHEAGSLKIVTSFKPNKQPQSSPDTITSPLSLHESPFPPPNIPTPLTHPEDDQSQYPLAAIMSAPPQKHWSPTRAPAGLQDPPTSYCPLAHSSPLPGTFAEFLADNPLQHYPPGNFAQFPAENPLQHYPPVQARGLQNSSSQFASSQYPPPQYNSQYYPQQHPQYPTNVAAIEVHEIPAQEGDPVLGE